jgi:hypothetical protein
VKQANPKTFQNHLPNQLIQNQNIITPWESKVLKVGAKVCARVEGLRNASKSQRPFDPLTPEQIFGPTPSPNMDGWCIKVVTRS